ncbi:CopG family transcriptional regulator [Caulobacter sp. B11]|uniref:CopG family transcriptional regulator n=1 Tax=Caulobacter sp. B11 TaxID=2048899 RepID=UPI000C12C1CF|nr:CopG family transcriptional regulator [Caulobacter sp. B11]PHY12927.1 CopG family transcriptional regulator [Caulobacter sp. B11]
MSKAEPSLFDETDAAEAAADERAEADIAAGRVVSHKAMKRWLLSWGTPNEGAPPKCGE